MDSCSHPDLGEVGANVEDLSDEFEDNNIPQCHIGHHPYKDIDPDHKDMLLNKQRYL